MWNYPEVHHWSIPPQKKKKQHQTQPPKKRLYKMLAFIIAEIQPEKNTLKTYS